MGATDRREMRSGPMKIKPEREPLLRPRSPTSALLAATTYRHRPDRCEGASPRSQDPAQIHRLSRLAAERGSDERCAASLYAAMPLSDTLVARLSCLRQHVGRVAALLQHAVRTSGVA